MEILLKQKYLEKWGITTSLEKLRNSNINWLEIKEDNNVGFDKSNTRIFSFFKEHPEIEEPLRRVH